jgi:putative aldouronate transport system permease protein
MASGKVSHPVFPKKRKPLFMRRKTRGYMVFDVLNASFLALFALSVIYPFWTVILASFSTEKEALAMGLRIWIREWTLSSYKFALSRYGNVGRAYLNSIFRTVIGTSLAVLVTILGAFPLSKRDLPGRNAVTVYILITMFFSGGLIPGYLLIRSLGLIDNRWVLVIPGLAGGFNIIIMRNFFMTIDKSFEESAFMDGANYLQILTRIIMPLTKPVIATVALWTAVGHWNAWFDALIYINSEKKLVLQLLLRRLIQDMTVSVPAMNEFMLVEHTRIPTEGVKAAIVILTIGPIVALYPFLQKYFIKGVFMGSLKG